MDSWQFFDMLLNKAGVVCTPGAGFGKCGNGYIRISAFNSHDKVKEAMQRLTSGTHRLIAEGKPEFKMATLF